ncbi:MAG: hypothetical protein NC319_00925 [Butyricicoccus sp.]|nr:hypothetical protein [Butyricicoccus sp.]
MNRALIIGERYRPRLEKPLEGLGMDVLWMRDNPYVDPRLAGHADLSAIRLGKRIVAGRHMVVDPLFVKQLTNRGYELISAEREQGARYPADVNLCTCVAANRFIHNLRYTDPAILKCFDGEKIHVNQGYTRCSCCTVDADALISSDSGIEHTARKNGIEVLKINAGGISLAGFGYGFIGGAAIVLDDTVLLSGRLENMRDMRSVESFIRSRGKLPVYLTQDAAFDIGGAIVL